jgi:hypothetical protein
MRAPVWLPTLGLTSAMLLAGPISAQDGGIDDVPLVCGATLTELGSCFGDTAAWCTQPNNGGQSPTAPVESTDCAALGARCTQHGFIGAWCTADDGETCAIATDDGTAQLRCGNGSEGPGPGCALNGGCVDDAPACTIGAPASCDGSDLILGCSNARQALLLRCASACEGAPPRCVGEPEGAVCRDEVAICADGLTCLGDGEHGYGRCTADGPLAAVDGGDSTWAPEEPGSGCRCVRPASADGAPWGLLALLGLVLGRCRHRTAGRAA